MYFHLTDIDGNITRFKLTPLKKGTEYEGLRLVAINGAIIAMNPKTRRLYVYSRLYRTIHAGSSGSIAYAQALQNLGVIGLNAYAEHVAYIKVKDQKQRREELVQDFLYNAGELGIKLTKAQEAKLT